MYIHRMSIQYRQQKLSLPSPLIVAAFCLLTVTNCLQTVSAFTFTITITFH